MEKRKNIDKLWFLRYFFDNYSYRKNLMLMNIKLKYYFDDTFDLIM